MEYLVEQGHDVVHSESYQTTREALSGKLETEAANQLAKERLERANVRKKGGTGGAVD